MLCYSALLAWTGKGVCAYLEVWHLGVALLRASVIRQLDVPEAGQLVHQDRVLLYEGVEDVLQTDSKQFSSAGFTARALLMETQGGSLL